MFSRILLTTAIVFSAIGVSAVIITPEHQARAREIVNQMTLDEKLSYIHGDQRFSLYPIPRLGVPAITMTDGPQGVRNSKQQSTLYPCGLMAAATWNKDLAYQFGKALGSDCRARGIDILLGPGVNIYRSPLCGRNFEYYGEDPYLASEITVNYINGVQDNGVIATVKHFCANNQEWNRHHTSSDVDERTLQEIYFPTFRKAVEKAGVGAVMNSYNMINGVHASENGWTNIDILRKKWGFKGILMSDWTSLYSTVNAINNGLDLEMPRGDHFNDSTLRAALKNGRITEKTIDDKIVNILATAIAFGILDRPSGRVTSIPLDDPASRKVALETAREGIVLLKNQDNVLPLKKGKTVILGNNADSTVFGGGSGSVWGYSAPTYAKALVDAKKGTMFLDNNMLYKTVGRGRTGADIKYTPEKDEIMRVNIGAVNGYKITVNGKALIDNWGTHRYERTVVPLNLKKGETYNFKVEFQNKKPKNDFYSLDVLNEELLAKELKSAKDVVVCTGFDALTESEGYDRNFGLSEYEDFFINYVASKNPNTIVVLNSGGAVDLSGWGDNVKGIVCAWYSGQEGGKALAEVLSGKISPSGKLPFTWDNSLEQSPTYGSYYANRPRTRNSNTEECQHIEYREGIFTGYRGYDQAGAKPEYPFGHGLSYSNFDLSNLQLSDGFVKEADTQEPAVMVSVNVKNTGKMKASETVQVYVRDKESSAVRPIKELKGFAKVLLNPGESQVVTIPLPKDAFEYFDLDSHEFVMEPGEFEILVGNSSANLPLNKTINL